MLKALFRVLIAAVVTASIATASLPARADGIENVYFQSVLPGANDAIKNAMDQAKAERDAKLKAQKAKLAPGTVAQAPPVEQQPVSTTVGFPKGFSYTADISAAYPYGNIGSYGRNSGWMSGGVDLSANYSWDPTWRLTASMFQLQHWPYGFNSGIKQVYLRGFVNPVGCTDLGGSDACGPGTGQNLNVRTKDTFGVFVLSKMVFPLGHLGVPLPLVISPTYVTRGGQIGESPFNNDVVPFAGPPPDGQVFLTTPTRTAQFKSVAFTLPFLKTPKMFGTFTLAPQWLVHTNGLNSTNSMQLAQIMYLEYTPWKNTTVFFEPQSARDYLPTDPYPEHVIAYFAGIAQHIDKNFFAEVVLNSGGPTNLGADGVTSITCNTVRTTTCGPTIGGLRATQVQFMVGIGSPNIFPL